MVARQGPGWPGQPGSAPAVSPQSRPRLPFRNLCCPRMARPGREMSLVWGHSGPIRTCAISDRHCGLAGSLASADGYDQVITLKIDRRWTLSH